MESLGGEENWLTVVKHYASERGIDPTFVQILNAFHPKTGDTFTAKNFENLREQVQDILGNLPQEIVATLHGEIDKPQAQLFSRRFESVVELLTKQAKDFVEAGLLRVGLIVRTHQILNAPEPRALRVRAVADFYYTQAAIIHHRPKDPNQVKDHQTLIDEASWTPLGEGASWKRVDGLTSLGPIHVNVLKLENPLLRTMDCRVQSAGQSLEAFAQQQNAMAAVSGGFFLYSEPDIQAPSNRTDPVGFLMDRGQILNPPVLHRATLTQSTSGQIAIGRLGPVGMDFHWDQGPTLRIEAHNQETNASVKSYNRAYGETTPPGGTQLLVVGNTIVNVSKHSLPIPLAGMVICLEGVEPPEPGTVIQWIGYHQQTHDPLQSAMAGGPMLVQNGELCIDREAEDFQKSAPPVTFSQDETFDQNLLPRMAAGLNEEGTLFFAAIDGRNFHRAPGMTLEQTARWMQALGCTTAMNLDGGSSKRMVVQNQVVDLSSTEVVGTKAGKESIRPVHSAILIYPNQKPE